MSLLGLGTGVVGGIAMATTATLILIEFCNPKSRWGLKLSLTTILAVLTNLTVWLIANTLASVELQTVLSEIILSGVLVFLLTPLFAWLCRDDSILDDHRKQLSDEITAPV